MLKTFKDVVINKELRVWWEKRPASWSKYEQHSLLVEYWPGTTIHHELGHIKKTNDGRWRWTALDSSDIRFAINKEEAKLQGVCQTKEDAEIKLETIWGLH